MSGPIVALAATFVMTVLFGGVGYVLLKASFSGFSAAQRALATAARAEGVVVEMRRDRSDLSIYDYPVVRFTTADGKVVDFEASIRQEPAAHKVGDKVQVHYPREDPSRADIVGTADLGHVLAGGLGLAFLLAGLIGAVVFVRCLVLGECPTETREGRSPAHGAVSSRS